jgi:hypothetical protein
MSALSSFRKPETSAGRALAYLGSALFGGFKSEKKDERERLYLSVPVMVVN